MILADIAWGAGLLVAGGAGVALTVMSLPGTWLILLAAALEAWSRSGEGLLGAPALVVLGGLAALGEVVELAAGALGARKAGASLRGSAGAMLGGIAGGVLGTIFIPILIVGSILGAATGAFIGALCGESLAGRSLDASVVSGRGAFFGRIAGTIAKLAVAAAMWIALALATFL